MQIKVGQQLYWVPTQSRNCGEPRMVTVVKVGRKWATLDNRERVDETLRVDGGQYSSPARCYLSKADHEEEVSIQDAWAMFFDELRNKFNPPEGVIVADIRTAREALRMKPI